MKPTKSAIHHVNHVTSILGAVPTVKDTTEAAAHMRMSADEAEEQLLQAVIRGIAPVFHALAGKVVSVETRAPGTVAPTRQHFAELGLSLSRGIEGSGLKFEKFDTKAGFYSGREIFLFQAKNPIGVELTEIMYSGHGSKLVGAGANDTGGEWRATRCTMSLWEVLNSHELEDLLGSLHATMQAQIRGSDRATAVDKARAARLRAILTLLDT